jgi:hypothetical protein
MGVNGSQKRKLAKRRERLEAAEALVAGVCTLIGGGVDSSDEALQALLCAPLSF